MSGKMKQRHTARTPLAATLLAFALVVAGCSSSESSTSKTIPVSPTPLVSSNIQQSLEAYKGKVVVLDFWATWCGPCRSEIPGLVQIQNKYRDQGVEIIGVSLDPITPGGSAAAVEPFMKSYNINYSIWMINDRAAMTGYDVSRGIPTKYVIGRDGKVVKSYVGARPASVVENDIKQLL